MPFLVMCFVVCRAWTCEFYREFRLYNSEYLYFQSIRWLHINMCANGCLQKILLCLRLSLTSICRSDLKFSKKIFGLAVYHCTSNKKIGYIHIYIEETKMYFIFREKMKTKQFIFVLGWRKILQYNLGKIIAGSVRKNIQVTWSVGSHVSTSFILFMLN